MDARVNLTCQRCSQLLKIHSTLRSMNTVSFQEIVCDRSSDFYSVEDSKELEEEDEQNHQPKVLARLFDILSDQSDIDHPLCEECANFIMEQMDNQLCQLELECKENKDFIQTVSQPSASPNLTSDASCDIKFLTSEIERLQQEEKDLIRQLEEITIEQKKVDDQISEQHKELEKIEKQNETYWNEYNHLKYCLFNLDDDVLSAENQMRYAQNHLAKLRKTNILNATFHIWHTGHFATINGFRLGRLPKFPVDWNEINAAWGQCVLLLHCLAKKINFVFLRYKLVPYGNHSFIEALDNKSRELPLYGSGGFRFIWNNKFDQAMVAFLDCLQQFKEQVEKEDSAFCLPYKMDKGRIEDIKNGFSFSIRTQFNSEEQWTKALKFMLTNLKWSLAFVASSNYD